MKNTVILLISIATFIACAKQKAEQVSTIDSTLQVRVDSILQNKLSELNATIGQAIVMEVRTGEIKAFVGSDSILQESGLVRTASLLAALETKAIKLSDTIDVGNGILAIGKDTLCDHNWHRGGYGELTVQEGLAASSNIAIYKTMEKAFGDNPQTFFDLLTNMSYGKPDSINGIASLQPYKITEKNITWNCIGYEQLISPIQVLTFYNAIANNGKMIQPQLYKDSVVVINPQIASRASIDSLKKALVFNVTDGLCQPAKSDKVLVAGMQGTSSLSTNEDSTKGMYAVEFCGYFPTDNPKYSIIVSINKAGLPASGGLMAGDVFRQIVDYMNE